MHDTLTEHAVAQYIAEQTDELISLVNFCPPSDRVRFLTYLLDMVRLEAKQVYESEAEPRPKLMLVYSRAETPAGD
ncbi:hypothetical protein G6M84_17765 [Agrobacterium tumefaciens]|uniref:hypothetical protein n=1 Tax=Agrobacterium tumefaciens TaxID=358 RepID=UPI00157241BD|nr:hypothetical protein [Agrobacterium tumefaciens]NTB98326.1 hypothetical protein [Agrobacterium tumefaciens]NTC45695.1 hypothetical protein [Agrobacterium tumefaciens]